MSTLSDFEAECHATPWVNSPIKRVLDVVVASLLVVILLPVLALGAAGVRLSSPGPILFRHRRAGRHGRPISVLKLRTMRQSELPGPHESSPDDDEARLTPYGRFLRRFSIDELPQLVNVIRGDMSIVGPRPLPVDYVERYSASQRCRLVARPGLTGLSQVEVRNAGDWDQKLSLDAEYVSRADIPLDIHIFFRTVGVVLRGSGINAPGFATMPEFKREQSSPDQ